MNSGPTLNTGSTGSHVKRLQRILVMKKILVNANPINGNYDTPTRDAVKNFQLEEGLTADGICGANTWNKLPADPNTPLLNIGSTGTAVTALQTFLNRVYPAAFVVIDGQFGPKTKGGVIMYQNGIGLTADGIVGDKTWWSNAGAAGATLASLCGLTTH